MAGLMEIFLLKERVNGERDNIFLILFEKASILIALLLIALVGVALEFPGWGVAVLLGASLGPVVYGHYYFIYVRPVKKKQNLDGNGKRASGKGK